MIIVHISIFSDKWFTLWCKNKLLFHEILVMLVKYINLCIVSSLQKMKAMEFTLSKASRVYPDCAAMIKKLRAMMYNAEEQVRSQRNQETFLRGLGGRTIPKGFHCLTMRLTAEYFALKPDDREFPNKHKLEDPHLYHFAVFSDNVLACAVVVNSTVSTARVSCCCLFGLLIPSLTVC